MKTIDAWKTDDGKVFTNRAQAERHEDELKGGDGQDGWNGRQSEGRRVCPASAWHQR